MSPQTDLLSASDGGKKTFRIKDILAKVSQSKM